MSSLMVRAALAVVAFLLAHVLEASRTIADILPPDVTVAADGSGDFTTIQAAIDSLPKGEAGRAERKVILVKDGLYKEKVRVDVPCVTLRGESRARTRVEFSQLADDFTARPDEIGRAVLNVNADDFVMENLTAANTAGVVGLHAFTIYGTGDRTVIVDCDVLSDGADTVSLWAGDRGRYYHARCHFRGATDFVCPRGWCYLTDCTFDQTKKSACVWHDGSKNQDQKFVIRNSKFDGIPGYHLARHHLDAAFYFLDCEFSKTMIDQPPGRVIYPIGDKPVTPADIELNKKYDRENRWGERAYFYHCRRPAGDYAWFADNLDKALGSPKPAEITAKWTFAGTWDPESAAGPTIRSVTSTEAGTWIVEFSEPVTVRGRPVLNFSPHYVAEYRSGSGTTTIVFSGNPNEAKPAAIELLDGVIIASQASASTRLAVLDLPSP